MHVIRAGILSSAGFAPLWSNLWEQSVFQHPLYSPLNIVYSKEYAADCTFEDLSFVVEEEGQPLIGVLVSLQTWPDGRRELSGFGRPILYLESFSPANGRRQKAHRTLREELDRICVDYGVDSISYQEVSPTLSEFGRYLLELGARPTPRFAQVIDLTLSRDELHRQVRRSYKGLINWGERHLSVRTLDFSTVAPEDLDSFRALHIQAAGRETRSRRSWDLQYQMVRQGEAILILGEWNNELVTGALFLHSSRYCYYGVSASNRELFDKPLSHCVIWNAIVRMKDVGCRFLEMGEQVFAEQGSHAPSAKQIGIGSFKRGFGGETHVRLEVVWKR